MRYRPNHAFDTELRAQPEYRAAIAEATVKVAAAVRIAAEPTRHTGYFLRRVVPVGNRVLLRDPFWHLVEYGSLNNPPYAPARIGVRAAGLRFDDNRQAG